MKIYLDLTKFEDYIKGNKDIIAAMYSGSVGRGLDDEFSDLDVELVVNKTFLSDAKGNLKILLKKIGKIKLLYFIDDKNVKSLIDDYQRIDFKLHTKDSLVPWGKYDKIKIIKENNDLLKNFSKEAEENKTKITPSFMEAEFKELVLSQILNANRSARGWGWNSRSWINYRVERLFVNLMKIRGKLQFDFSNVENLLDKNEMELLKDAYCISTSKKDIKKSLEALWRFSKYVFKEYEKVSGKILKLEINEKEILDKIGRILR